MRQMTVSALTDKDLTGARDNEVGDIERIVESNADKKQYLVISRGGFLGLFETEVMIPLENVAAQGDRIVLRNLTEEQVKAEYRRVDTTDVRGWRLEVTQGPGSVAFTVALDGPLLGTGDGCDASVGDACGSG